MSTYLRMVLTGALCSGLLFMLLAFVNGLALRTTLLGAGLCAAITGTLLAFALKGMK